MGKTFDYLLSVRERRGAAYLALLDPDRLSRPDLIRRAEACAANGVDALLFGTSLLLSSDFDGAVREIKRAVDLPVIIHPGDINQVAPHADALLFLSMISGRNPELLIGQQVKAAPLLRACGLEPISTGLILVESGKVTSAEYISNTKPLPRDKPDIAMAHALAAQYLGMHCVYLEGGSGAAMSVPEEIIRAVSSYITLPVIVGGGIRTPEAAAEKVQAGASLVVIGNAIEQMRNASLIRELADAIHTKG
ncbi:MAG: geranylgeranylglyceryl/heptaprenylglyceryl phosphate synthase [Candidatus Handelsmanbacteria bacterium RIFCSPLOWO2_12_FULL_64_10]|uniref:Phosphoglycerol geranylgeranyltransferase n=1 Tax=Handelsmanbacteria sp. (strain RIFCSPLOWO2_12_FULL_64_10) TaxID=1817868 RepID=A0A1F6CKM1_HANXR|nr:MAG: geranylgeranylglyceryl/heptaprenylglyceryl phosphate synthase [Candidatus Handelsmanbacteria bacterium RIFCSPLOWO2_12_FULL_64_10]